MLKRIRIISIVSILILVSIIFFNCNRKKDYSLYRKESINKLKGISDIQLCLKINDKKEITYFNMTSGSKNNYRELRNKARISNFSNLFEIDRVVFPIDSNFIEKNNLLDTSIYNSVIRKLFSNGIEINEKQKKDLLLKSNILIDFGNPNWDFKFYPDDKDLVKKLDSIFMFYFVSSKTNNFNEDLWNTCNNYLVLRTIGYIKINPKNYKFIICSHKRNMNFIFIGYKIDKKGTLTNLELLNPAPLLSKPDFEW